MNKENPTYSQKKEKNAKEIAEIMVQNMAVNMEDPNFLDDQERIKDNVRHKILEKRRKRLEKQEKEKRMD